MSGKALDDGGKAYGSIPHLPGSRRGPGDHGINDGQARMCLEALPDSSYRVVVQEKLDGSCVAVARLESTELVALGRAGYRAGTSKYEQHHMFAAWVAQNRAAFEFLQPGERLVGEWLAQAHGTRYGLGDIEPFAPFDLITGRMDRLPFLEFQDRICRMLLTTRIRRPRLIHMGAPKSLAWVIAHLEPSGHGAIDHVEGAVWRVERRIEGKWRVQFLAKWVRPDKKDGCYLPEINPDIDAEPVWNWRPEGA